MQGIAATQQGRVFPGLLGYTRDGALCDGRIGTVMREAWYGQDSSEWFEKKICILDEERTTCSGTSDESLCASGDEMFPYFASPKHSASWAAWPLPPGLEPPERHQCWDMMEPVKIDLSQVTTFSSSSRLGTTSTRPQHAVVDTGHSSALTLGVSLESEVQLSTTKTVLNLPTQHRGCLDAKQLRCAALERIRPSRARGGCFRFVCKFVFTGFDLVTDADFELVPRLIGRCGANMKEVAHVCHGKVRIRGKGSGHEETQKGRPPAEANVPLQIVLSCTESSHLEKGKMMLNELVTGLSRHFEKFRRVRGLEAPTALYTLME
mmetsp:Transcript_24859/g.65323  ORF Transcript_24859/g.65323 Transcript_24859/m.65323 type:complete len:321 (-) Transcript_24859:127-1089(-)